MCFKFFNFYSLEMLPIYFFNYSSSVSQLELPSSLSRKSPLSDPNSLSSEDSSRVSAPSDERLSVESEIISKTSSRFLFKFIRRLRRLSNSVNKKESFYIIIKVQIVMKCAYYGVNEKLTHRRTKLSN